MPLATQPELGRGRHELLGVLDRCGQLPTLVERHQAHQTAHHTSQTAAADLRMLKVELHLVVGPLGTHGRQLGVASAAGQNAHDFALSHECCSVPELCDPGSHVTGHQGSIRVAWGPSSCIEEGVHSRKMQEDADGPNSERKHDELLTDTCSQVVQMIYARLAPQSSVGSEEQRTRIVSPLARFKSSCVPAAVDPTNPSLTPE